MNRSIVCLEKHVEEVWLHAHPCFSSFLWLTLGVTVTVVGLQEG